MIDIWLEKKHNHYLNYSEIYCSVKSHTGINTDVFSFSDSKIQML